MFCAKLCVIMLVSENIVYNNVIPGLHTFLDRFTTILSTPKTTYNFGLIHYGILQYYRYLRVHKFLHLFTAVFYFLTT